MIEPTNDDVGRKVFYVPDLKKQSSVGLAIDDAKAGVFLGVRENDARVLVSFDSQGEGELIDPADLVWRYCPRRTPNNFGAKMLTGQVYNTITILAPDWLDDAVKKLAGDLTHPETGEEYSEEQIRKALWVWLQAAVSDLVDCADEWCSDSIGNTATYGDFDDILCSIAESEKGDAQRERERLERQPARTAAE